MSRFHKTLLPVLLFVAACDSDDDDATDVAEAEDRSAEAEGRHGRGKLEKLDTDKDGAISLAEAEGHKLATRFADLDKDGDGKLVKEELAAMKHRRGDGHDGKIHGWKSKDPAERAAKTMTKLDTDGDGAISTSEVVGHRLEEKFAKIDADGDGKLTKDELVAYKKAKHDRGPSALAGG